MRMLSASILAAILGLPLVSSGSQEPPSSLDPGQHGTVNLSHTAKRVKACAFNKQRQTCTAEKESVDSSTSVTLTPIADAQIATKDKRETVVVHLGKEGGVAQKLQLGVGVWEIAWPGKQEKDRFFVAENDEFDVKLVTQVGSCKKDQDRCALKPDANLVQVKIPARCRR
jgi:hypothetical protein